MTTARLSLIRSRRGLSSRWAGPPDDRGSVTGWMVLAAFAMAVLVGLAVDLGGQVWTRQRAMDVAAQAARAGGQQLQEAPAVRGQRVATDPARARAAAQAYLAAAGMPGTVSVRGGTTVRVDTQTTYPTQFLTLIGIHSLAVSGSAESRTVRVVQGRER